MKSPSPIVQKNPIADYQVLRVCKNQEINIVLSGDQVGKTVKVTGLFLKLDAMIVYNSKGVTHTIRQIRCFDLNRASTCFLGTIVVGDNVHLLVYMESDHVDKKDFLTLIDPYVDTIRLKPHQVLEVVMTDNAGWDWAWYPKNPTESSSCIALQEIGRRFYSPTIGKWKDQHYADPYFAEQKLKHQIPEKVLQTHFWFRFDSSMLAILEEDKLGRGHIAGSLVIFTRAEEDYACVDVLVDVSKKYITQFGSTLTLGKYGPNYQYRPVDSGRRTHPDNNASDVGYGNESDWKKEKFHKKHHYLNEEYVGNGDDDTWIIESKPNHVVSYKKQPKVVEKILMEVEISEVENPDLYEGCATEEWPKVTTIVDASCSDCC